MNATTLERSGPYPMGLMGLLATVTMLFAAFTAALLMRRAGSDWIPVELPWVSWPATAVIALSSLTLERARRAAGEAGGAGVTHWLGATTVLGGAFLIGQAMSWRLLAARGVFLPTSPHAAFFYLLTAVHGAHVLGGLGALAWVTRRASRSARVGGGRTGLDHAAVYWHFVGGVWTYLLVLLLTL
jgi:cytochrome c oxidase subunit 3